MSGSRITNLALKAKSKSNHENYEFVRGEPPPPPLTGYQMVRP